MTQKSVNHSFLLALDHRSEKAALPEWARSVIRSQPQSGVPVKGRVLRLKLGYNPNSSSVGSGVYVLPILLLGISTLFGAVAGLISSAIAPGRNRARKAPFDAPSETPDNRSS